MNYLNTENAYILFQKALRSEIYVDKSMLIDKISSKIGTDNQYICITRPRRFGKSMNLYMMGAYYTKGLDSGHLFETLAVSRTEGYGKNRNCYNVIYIDFSSMLNDSGESFLFLLDEWDSIFYKNFMTLENKNEYLEFLQNLLKD